MARWIAALIVIMVGALGWATDIGVAQTASPARLTPIVSTGDGIGRSRVSADGLWVWYQSRPVEPGPEDVWVVPTSGGARSRLTPINSESSSVKLVEFTPDSRTVVYMYRTEAGNGGVSLYAASVEDGTPRRLVGPLGVDHVVQISEVAVTPDSSRALYLVSVGDPAEVGMWSVPIDGGTPVRLRSGQQDRVTVVPGRSQVLYASTEGLFRLPIDGGMPTLLYSLNGTEDAISSLTVSPDSERAVFLTTTGSAEQPVRVVSVPIAGGGATVLDGPLPLPGSFAFPILADASRIVYKAAVRSGSLFDLYSVPIRGGAAVRLNEDLGALGSVTSAQLSPDSRSVVYRVDADGSGATELFTTAPTGGTPLSLSGRSENIAIGGLFSITPDSNRVVYEEFRVGNRNSDRRLRSVSILGGQPVDIAASLEFIGRTTSFGVTPDSSRVIVVADPNLFDAPGRQYALYSIPIAGGAPVRLAESTDLAGRFEEWVVYATAEHFAILISSHEHGRTTALYRVDPGVAKCDGRPATIVGSDGPDSLTGGPGPDVILAGGGADTIDAGGGDDLVCGQAGDDVISGGDGADTVWAGGGDDVVSGGAGGDQLHGGDGNDLLRGQEGADSAWGDAGADRLFGGPANDALDGGSGNDELRGQAGADKIYGRKGADRIFGGSGRDELRGQRGRDFIKGNKGSDKIYGGPGRDVLRGNSGADLISGGSGRDVLKGNSGRDMLRGGRGKDRCVGGPGRDNLSSCEER